MITICQFVVFSRLIIHNKLTEKPLYIFNPIIAQEIIKPLFHVSCNSGNRISLYPFYPIKNAREVEFRLWRVSRVYPNGNGNGNGKGRKYTISRRARSFPAVASRTQGYSRQSRYERRAFRLLRGPSETRDLSTGFPHVAILAFKSSDLFVVYLSTLSTIRVSAVRRRDDGGDSPSWTQFGRYSVSLFLFPSPPLNLFYGLQHACGRSTYTMPLARRAISLFFFMPLESLHDWKKPTDCKLIKADQKGTESSTDNGGDFFDLLHWFRRTRVDLSGSWTRGSSSTYYLYFLYFVFHWWQLFITFIFLSTHNISYFKIVKYHKQIVSCQRNKPCHY